MRGKQKKYTIISAICMIIFVVLTFIIFTNSIQCGRCNGKITGKYYLSIFGDRPYCEACGTEYYQGYPGNLDNVSGHIDNTMRNALVIAELVGFIGIMIFINYRAKKNSEISRFIMDKGVIYDEGDVSEIEKTVCDESNKKTDWFKPAGDL